MAVKTKLQGGEAARRCRVCRVYKIREYFDDWDDPICINCVFFPYSLTPEERIALNEEHKVDYRGYGKCGICRNRRKLIVDHDHKTGKVRGLLCSACNSGIGCFKDNPKYLKKAIAYLAEN